jgi:hypothetical protein
MKQTMWTMEIARAKVQVWYDDLKKAINASDWVAVGSLYNPNSLLCARGKGKAYTSSKAIERFWKSNHLEISIFKIEIKCLFPSASPARQGLRQQLQTAFWTGRLVAKKGGQVPAKIDYVFCGSGPHLEPCDYGNPDFEIYPF